VTSRLAEFAHDELRLELTPGQREALTAFEAGNYAAAVWQWGRRSGKSLLSDVLVLFDACVRDDLRRFVRPGEERISAVIAPRLEQSRAHVRNCRSMIETSATLGSLLIGETADELHFSNKSVIRAYPCSGRTIRGGAFSSVVLDELAHYLDTDGNSAGDAVLEAATPALAQFGDSGWLIAISTPRWRSGTFWMLVDRAQSGRFRHIHYLHKSTADMNPKVSPAWLEERRREDPDLYSREFLAQFVDGIASYLTSSDIMACVRRGQSILPPAGHEYSGALDVAYSRDKTALVVGHKDDGIDIIDGCWTWHRAGHEGMLSEVADVLGRYGIRTVRIDQFAETAVRETLAKYRIEADYLPWTNESKANAFGRLKASINTRSIELPDDRGLIDELVSLEGRKTPSGLTRIAAAGDGSDDRATALASLVDGMNQPAFEMAPPYLIFDSTQRRLG